MTIMQFQSDINKGVVQSPIYDFSESKPPIRYNNLELPKEYNYPSFEVPLILITYQIGIYTMQLSNRRLIGWKVIAIVTIIIYLGLHFNPMTAKVP